MKISDIILSKTKMITLAIPVGIILLNVFTNGLVLGFEVNRGRSLHVHHMDNWTTHKSPYRSTNVSSVSKILISPSVGRHNLKRTPDQVSRTRNSLPEPLIENKTNSVNPRFESEVLLQNLLSNSCRNGFTRNIKENISLKTDPQQISVASNGAREQLVLNSQYNQSSHLATSHLEHIIRFRNETPSSQMFLKSTDDHVKLKTPPDKTLSVPLYRNHLSSTEVKISEHPSTELFHRAKRSKVSEHPSTELLHRTKRSHIFGIKSHDFGLLIDTSGPVPNSSFHKVTTGDQFSLPHHNILSDKIIPLNHSATIVDLQELNSSTQSTSSPRTDADASTGLDSLNADGVSSQILVGGVATEDLPVWTVKDVSNKWCQPAYNVLRSHIIKLNCSGQDFLDVPPNVRLFIPDTIKLWFIGSDFKRLSDLVVNTSTVKVSYLHMDGSNVTELDSIFRIFEAQTLELLSLRENMLSRVTPGSLAQVLNLEYLYMSGNNINNLEPNTFDGNPLLKEIDLSENRLTRLEKNTFENNKKLEMLFLDGNEISIIENHTFTGLENIISIDLANNYLGDQLTINTNMFAGCASMSNLVLTNCQITMIAKETFRELKKLHALNLSKNKLTHIPDGAFAHLHSLSLLNLGNNYLKSMTRLWQLPQSLKALMIEHNSISYISADVFNGLDLTNLFLNNNDLETVPMTAQMYMTTRKNVSFSFNPWRCDCDLIFLIHFAKNSPYAEPNLICDAPLKTRMSHIRENTVKCPPMKGCHGNHCEVCTRALQRPVGDDCVCMEGTYYASGTVGQDGCKACPAQTYKNTTGNEACTPCSTGSMPITGPAPMCMCAVGYFTNPYGDCEKCPEGTYKNYVGMGSCSPCTATDSNVFQCTSRHHAIQTQESNTNVLPIVIAVIIVVVICVVVFLGLLVRHYRSKRRLLKRYCGKMKTRSHVLHVSMEDAHFSSVSNTSTSVEFRCSGRHSIRLKEIGGLIGRGAFGQVFEGQAYLTSYDKEPIKVAVKRLKEMATEDEVKNLREELEQMINVGPHPNIIGLYGSAVYEGQYCIIMEYAELGDLLTYLKTECPFPLQYVSVGSDGLVVEQSAPKVEDNANLMMFAWQIAKGMRHLEMHRYIHRDLAARNCLLTKGPIAKVSDFGLSKDAYELGHYKRVQKDRVPFKWLSPEALLWGQYSGKSDVWAFGVLLWELYTFGGTPYPQVTTEQLRELHEYGYRMPKPPACPEQLYRIMRTCWREDPRQRPSFKQLEQTLDHLIQQTRKVEYIDLDLHGLKSSTPVPLTPEDLNDQVTSVEFVYRAKRQATYQNRLPLYQSSDGHTGMQYTSVYAQSGDSQYNDENFPILVGGMSKGDSEIDSESTVTSGFQSMSSAQTM